LVNNEYINSYIYLIVFTFLFNFYAPCAEALTTTEAETVMAQIQQQIAQIKQRVDQLGPLTPSETETVIAEIQQQINQIVQQITQLKPQLVTLAKWCYDFKYNFGAGSSGSKVAALQIALEKEGFSINKEEKDKKDFGESTASAVVGFQQKYKEEILTPWGLQYGTGTVGKTTRAKLNKLYGCSAPTPTPTTPTPTTPTPTSTASIIVLSPNGGENLIDGNTYTISWKSDNAPAGSTVGLRFVRMEQITKWDTGEKYWAESGFDQPLQTPPNLPTTGTFQFVPHIPCITCGYQYLIDSVPKYYRISATLFRPGAVNYGSNTYAKDLSDNNFTVTMPAGVTRSLKIDYPNTDVKLMFGGPYSIKWTSSGIPADIRILINWGATFGGTYFADTTNAGSYNGSWMSNMGSSEQWAGKDFTINVAAVDKYGVTMAYDESEPFRIEQRTSDYAFAPTALSLSGPDKIKKGENLTVSWTSEPDGWGILCRLWFDGTQKLITGLPRSGNYSFPTDSLTVGNSYGYVVRCFSTWTIQKYGGNMASIPDAEGNALGKSVLISQ